MAERLTGSDEEPINNEAGLDSGQVDLSIW